MMKKLGITLENFRRLTGSLYETGPLRGPWTGDRYPKELPPTHPQHDTELKVKKPKGGVKIPPPAPGEEEPEEGPERPPIAGPKPPEAPEEPEPEEEEPEEEEPEEPEEEEPETAKKTASKVVGRKPTPPPTPAESVDASTWSPLENSRLVKNSW